jgi:deoxyribonuclease-4
MYGSHLSIAGSMVNALREAEALGLDTVQVFTKNQQQWSVKPLDESMRLEWRAELSRLGWEGRTVSHASYLINLASHDDALWTKSVDLMQVEIERCQALGIAFLVHHPGSFVGWTLDEGLERIADAYRELLSRTRGFATVLCLEGTAGAGSQIGGPFEHLAALRRLICDRVKEPGRVGVCLDTCHMHAAGYDLSTRELAEEALDTFARIVGMEHLRVMHMNDSKGKVGSHLDRHEHIGQGWVGGGARPHTGEGEYSSKLLHASGFAAVVNHPHIRTIPKILETPKGTAPDGRAWDSVNLERLQSLSGDAEPRSAANKPARGSSPTLSTKPQTPTKPTTPTTPTTPAKKKMKATLAKGGARAKAPKPGKKEQSAKRGRAGTKGRE